MKKFITTALLAALTATSIFAFTACGGNANENENEDENKEPVYTVTAEEWKTAFNYFKVEEDEEDNIFDFKNPKNNFTCETKTVYNGVADIIKVSFDFKKKAVEFVEIDAGREPATLYAWRDGNSYFCAEEWNGESYKEEYEDDKHMFEGGSFYFMSGWYIMDDLDLINKFSEFTYSEEKCEYTATVTEKNSTRTNDVTIKMKNGKLIYMAGDFKGDMEYKYTYGTSVTVPDKFLKMEVSE